MQRLFCAIKVPLNEAIEEVFETFRNELSTGVIKWINIRHLHITLKFFGDTAPVQVAPIEEALHLTAASCPPFSFRIRGCGIFGKPCEPRVIWLGVREAKQLIELYESVQHQLLPLGYTPDRNLFSPHLTIGRIKYLHEMNTLNSLQNEFSDTPLATVQVTAFHLFESKLHPHGPEYTILDTFCLGEGHRA